MRHEPAYSFTFTRVAGPRSGRSSTSITASSAAARNTAAQTNT